MEKTAYHFDKLFDYMLPPDMWSSVRPGCRVLVPFGGGNSRRQAVVFSAEDIPEIPHGVKPVLRQLDAEPVLSEEQLKLAEWLREGCFCTYFEAARVMLPTGMNLRVVCSYAAREGLTLEELDEAEELTQEERRIASSLVCSDRPIERERLLDMFGLSAETQLPANLVKKGYAVRCDDAVRKTGDATVKMVRLAVGEGDESLVKLSKKQQAVVELLEQAGSASVKEICFFADVTQAVLTGLKKRGAIEYFENEVYRRPKGSVGITVSAPEIKLTDEQQRAYEHISARLKSRSFSTTLLYGVTGSGKTSVFMRVIDDTVAEGRGVIVMVPEIALTPQTLGRFRSRYGERIAVFHSGLSLGQRMDEWKRVKNGDAQIVIGTRSAVFAPMKDIGLIVMDEEQEYTYKSESSPRYHAREVARFRCAYHKAPLLLASATPSIESYYLARQGGSYELETLTQRYGEAQLPTVDIVDISEQRLSESVFSPQLKEAIAYNLEKGCQSILLHNRRGFNTFVSCRACGQVLTCEHCSVSMTFHLDTRRLMCHYCGRTIPVAAKCPSCGSEQLRYAGQGTQRAEDELQRLFPQARVLRMDADSTQARFSHADKLAAFERGDFDIMIGTQMVAKGLDFAKVTLVGVMLADQMLYGDDFRSYERAFSLLTQVVGRSGRGEFSGRAIIQTLTPENPVIGMAARQDYGEFFRNEITMRRAMLYPPFSDICMIGFVGIYEDVVRRMSQTFLRLLTERAESEYPDLPLRVLGPSPAAINRVKSKYRYRLIIKCRRSARFRELISSLLAETGAMKEFRTATVFADMNPDNVM